MNLTNAFSLNMVAFPATINVEEVAQECAAIIASTCTSAVGHADTAAVFSSVLGTNVPMNRVTLQLKAGEKILVGQYIGPRLPEGSTSLPEGAMIKWLMVSIS